MSEIRTLEALLSPISTTAARHVKAILRHYIRLVEYFRLGNSENCLVKAGKFTEATLKALYVHAGRTPPRGREFKVDSVVRELAGLDKHSFDDTHRLLMPRACRFLYDLCSNRGGRHDPDNIDANEMDARIAVEVASWILAELIRFSQMGQVLPDEARGIVDALTEKKYSVVEEIDGRVYFNKREKSAADVALVVLWKRYPNRVGRRDLKESIMRHAPEPSAARFSSNAASVALTRIAPKVDDDGAGNLRLLSSGLAEAETLVSGATTA